MQSASAAIPPLNAVCPAYLPNTSITMMRLCVVPVVFMSSTIDAILLMAESPPTEYVIRSKSIVLGACTQGIPCSDRSTTTLPVSSPPEITRPSMLCLRSPSMIRSYFSGSLIFEIFTLLCPASLPANCEFTWSVLSSSSSTRWSNSTRLYSPA